LEEKVRSAIYNCSHQLGKIIILITSDSESPLAAMVIPEEPQGMYILVDSMLMHMFGEHFTPSENVCVCICGLHGIDKGTISPMIQSTNQSRVPSSRPRADVRSKGKDTRSNPEHYTKRKS